MLNERIKHVLILAAASILVATACFHLGGIVADAAGASEILGVTFQTGGALAGFVITLVLLFYIYQNIHVERPVTINVTVVLSNGTFTKKGNDFSAKATIMKRATIGKTDRSVPVVWQAGGLTVQLRDIEPDDLVMITISDARGGNWQSEFFSPYSTNLTLA